MENKKIIGLILCFIYRGMVRLKRTKLWFYHGACIGYCVLRKVKFNIDKVRFHGNNYLLFSKHCKIAIGDGFILSSGGIDNSVQSKIVVHHGAELNIGKYVGMSNVCVHCFNNISIGDYVNIGAGSMIFDSDFHSTFWKDRLNRGVDVRKKKTAPIHIGDLCFIGTRCIIGKGVTIGDRTIIAAGSVVVKSIPADCLAGGNPCKVIRFLDH